MDLDDQLQKLVELTGRDPDPEKGPQMSPGVYQILNPLLSSIIITEHCCHDRAYHKTNNLPLPCFLSMSNVFSAGPRLEPLSAPQPTFKHDYDGRTYTLSNCSLLHKLLIIGQEEQVVSRRGELNRDLLSTTCENKFPSGTTFSKVKCRIRFKCRFRHT